MEYARGTEHADGTGHADGTEHADGTGHADGTEHGHCSAEETLRAPAEKIKPSRAMPSRAMPSRAMPWSGAVRCMVYPLYPETWSLLPPFLPLAPFLSCFSAIAEYSSDTLSVPRGYKSRYKYT